MPKKLLAGKTARNVVSTGMPAFMYSTEKREKVPGVF